MVYIAQLVGQGATRQIARKRLDGFVAKTREGGGVGNALPHCDASTTQLLSPDYPLCWPVCPLENSLFLSIMGGIPQVIATSRCMQENLIKCCSILDGTEKWA